jgi:hypothetical protein
MSIKNSKLMSTTWRPVFRVPSRAVPPTLRVQLVAAAAGRCEFFGCAAFLYEHHVSLVGGNFARDSHIYAFSPDGPRGRVRGRPADIHALENLMLLCGPCHDMIDKNTAQYPVRRLRQFKAMHEQRMRHLTGLPLDAKSEVVVLKATIDRRKTAVTFPAICNALLPDRYPMSRDGRVIDLATFDHEDPGFFDRAMTAMREQIGRLHARDLTDQTPLHYSVFAIGPIPLLIGLGSLMPSTIRFDFFQHHRRGSGTWAWSTRAPSIDFTTVKRQAGTRPDRVALLLSISGEVQQALLPMEFGDAYTIYELRPTKTAPALGLVASRDTLESFRVTYRATIATVRTRHLPNGGELHVFPAIPPASALACGYDLLPKVDPTLVLYDCHRSTGGFIPKLRINRHDRS